MNIGLSHEARVFQEGEIMNPARLFVRILAAACLLELLVFGMTGSAQTNPLPIVPTTAVFHLDDVVKKGLTKAPEARGDFATTAMSDWATGRAIALTFKTIKTHTHTDHSHVLYILEGWAKFTVGKDTLEAGVGDVVLMPPNVAHKFEAMGDEPVKALLVNVAGVSLSNSTWEP
jgi:mannose-6-phosphate isomerase-like protein (cupin superfamily)